MTSTGTVTTSSPAGTQTTIDSPEFVATLTNHDDTDFVCRYLTSMYTIPAHASMVVPWDVMCAFVGNPHLKTHERKNCADRLAFRYHPHNPQPDLRAYNIMTGDEYNTVLKDPEGNHQTTASTTIADQSAMEAQIAHLTQQLANMQQVIAGNMSIPTFEPSAVERAATGPLEPSAVSDEPSTTSGPPGQFGLTVPVFDLPPSSAVPMSAPATGAVEDA